MSWMVNETVTSSGRYNLGSNRFGFSSAVILISDIDLVVSSLLLVVDVC